MASSESSVRKLKKAAKRPRSEDPDPDRSAAEERDQRQHAALCATLRGEDASVRLLEELVFGAEERLAERLTVRLGSLNTARSYPRDSLQHTASQPSASTRKHLNIFHTTESHKNSCSHFSSHLTVN